MVSHPPPTFFPYLKLGPCMTSPGPRLSFLVGAHSSIVIVVLKLLLGRVKCLFEITIHNQNLASMKTIAPPPPHEL